MSATSCPDRFNGFLPTVAFPFLPATHSMALGGVYCVPGFPLLVEKARAAYVTFSQEQRLPGAGHKAFDGFRIISPRLLA